jgi:hypothetical protein
VILAGKINKLSLLYKEEAHSTGGLSNEDGPVVVQQLLSDFPENTALYSLVYIQI